MPCESCNVQFTVFKRKKSCTECRRLYCKECLIKNKDKLLCDRCVILTRRPISKNDLFKLKPKDLIFYLQSKHISTTGCVEKEELVNLVLAHINSGNYYSNNGTGFSNYTSGDGGNDSDNVSNSFDQIKQTCQNLFSSFTEKIADLQKPGNNDTRPSSSNERNTERNSNITTQPRSNSRSDISSNNSNGNTFRYAQSNTNPLLPQNSREGSTSGIANKSPVTSNSSTTTSRRTSKTNSMSSSVLTSPTNSGFSSNDDNNSKYIPNSSNNLPSVHNTNKLKQNIVTDACGCECSDDEIFKSNICKTRKKSKSEIHLLNDENQAGPSGVLSTPSTDTSNSPQNKSNTMRNDNPQHLPRLDETDSSSFEEIIAVNVDDSWQIINPSTNSSQNETTVPSSSPLVTSNDNNSTESNNSKKREKLIKIRKVTRTRSDTCITNGSKKINSDSSDFRNMNTSSGRIDDVDCEDLNNDESVQSIRKRKKCCSRCGKAKIGIKKKILKFRKQLEASNNSEAEKKRQLDEFLLYLEQKSLNSQHDDISDSESNTEDDVHIALSSSNTANDYEMTEDENLGIYVYPSDETAFNQDANLKSRESYNKRISELISNKSIQLHDIQSSDDLESLTVKQLKQILVLNRVDFRGCVEKNELKERVLRLWNDHASGPSIDKLQVDDLCKICMDAPIECVILECGHMATCTNCGKVLSECPICRQYIVRVVRFFRA